MAITLTNLVTSTTNSLSTTPATFAASPAAGYDALIAVMMLAGTVTAFAPSFTYDGETMTVLGANDYLNGSSSCHTHVAVLNTTNRSYSNNANLAVTLATGTITNGIVLMYGVTGLDGALLETTGSGTTVSTWNYDGVSDFLVFASYTLGAMATPSAGSTLYTNGTTGAGYRVVQVGTGSSGTLSWSDAAGGNAWVALKAVPTRSRQYWPQGGNIYT